MGNVGDVNVYDISDMFLCALSSHIHRHPLIQFHHRYLMHKKFRGRLILLLHNLKHIAWKLSHFSAVPQAFANYITFVLYINHENHRAFPLQSFSCVLYNILC